MRNRREERGKNINTMSGASDGTSVQYAATGKVGIPIFQPTTTPLQYATMEPALRAALLAKGCGEAWTKTKPAALPADSVATANYTTAHTAAMKVNNNACGIFTTAFQKCPALQIMLLETEAAPNWPFGKTWEVVKSLHNEFKEEDIEGKKQRRHDLAAITMSTDEDPNVLFNKIQGVNLIYRGTALKMNNAEL